MGVEGGHHVLSGQAAPHAAAAPRQLDGAGAANPPHEGDPASGQGEVEGPVRVPVGGEGEPGGHRPEPLTGEEIYRRYCAVCHGDRGEGVPGYTLKLAPILASRSADQLRQTIKDGKPGTEMPAWGALLSQEEMDGLLRFLKQRGGSSKDIAAPSSGKEAVSPCIPRSLVLGTRTTERSVA